MKVFKLIDAEKTSYSVSMLCKVLKVSRSGYYDCRAPPSSTARAYRWIDRAPPASAAWLLECLRAAVSGETLF